MPRLSILDLEQRVTPHGELQKLNNLLESCYISQYESFNDFLKRNFHYFPYVGTSRTLNEYLTDRGISISPISTEHSIETLLYSINFYQTYTQWINTNIVVRHEMLGNMSTYDRRNYFDQFNIKIERFIGNILPLLNYKTIYEEEDNQYGFKTPLIVKRDTDVDSVLPLVDSDIRIDLLSYLDFRVENNLQAKEDILARLYKTIIDDGKEIYFTAGKTDDFRLKYQNELYERIKLVYNQTNIRHGGQGKIVLTDEEKHKYYDMCFYLLLQLIRTPKSIEDMKEIKDTFAQKQKVNT